jgi:hypothetical protein
MNRPSKALGARLAVDESETAKTDRPARSGGPRADTNAAVISPVSVAMQCRASLLTYMITANDHVSIDRHPLLSRSLSFWRANIQQRLPYCPSCKANFADGARPGAFLFATIASRRHQPASRHSAHAGSVRMSQMCQFGLRRLTTICSWRFMICLEHYSHHWTQHQAPAKTLAVSSLQCAPPTVRSLTRPSCAGRRR